MLGKKDHLAPLASVSLFENCSKKELRLIANTGSIVDLPVGRELTHEGSTGHDAFVILEGTVTAERDGRKVAELGPGAFIGELSLLDGAPRSATVTCTTPCRVLVLSRGEFIGMLQTVPSLTRKLLASLAGRVRERDKERLG